MRPPAFRLIKHFGSSETLIDTSLFPSGQANSTERNKMSLGLLIMTSCQQLKKLDKALTSRSLFIFTVLVGDRRPLLLPYRHGVPFQSPPLQPRFPLLLAPRQSVGFSRSRRRGFLHLKVSHVAQRHPNCGTFYCCRLSLIRSSSIMEKRTIDFCDTTNVQVAVWSETHRCNNLMGINICFQNVQFRTCYHATDVFVSTRR